MANAIVLTVLLTLEMVPYVPTTSGAQLVTVYGADALKLNTLFRV